MSRIRTTRRGQSSSNLSPSEKAATLGVVSGVGCLVACFSLIISLVCVLLALALKVAIISAIITGVYWCFTGEWIGDAAFLN